MQEMQIFPSAFTPKSGQLCALLPRSIHSRTLTATRSYPDLRTGRDAGPARVPVSRSFPMAQDRDGPYSKHGVDGVLDGSAKGDSLQRAKADESRPRRTEAS